MYTLEDVKKVQRRLLEMAVAVRDVLEHYNLPYFITYGTLLGAVRHKGFIPWDDDFDFYILAEYYDEAMIRLREELPESCFLENADSEPIYFHGWAHVKDMNSIVECSQYPQDSLYAHKGISVDLYKATKMLESDEQEFRLNEHIEYLYRKLKHGLIDSGQFETRVCELKQNLQNVVENKDLTATAEIYTFPSTYKDRLYLDELFPLVKYEFENTYFYGPKDFAAFLTRCYGDFMQLPPEEKRVPHYSSVVFLED